MRGRMFLPLLACLIACPRAKEPTVRVEQPKVVVALVVDQLAAWIAAERLPLLPATGGFARLRREGTWVREMRYAHAVTDTAPGHAALFTGKPPRESGIVANERLAFGKPIPFLRDEATKLVGDVVTETPGSSAAALRAPTVADRLRAAHPKATIVSLSIKDRGAIFGGGKAPTATLWFDAGLDRFVTSTAFASSVPPWAAPYASHDAVVAARKSRWEILDEAFVKAHATGDDAIGEGDWEGLGATFPHDVTAAKKPAVAFRATPFADEAVLALAAAAVRARDEAEPMLLSVSLSANDYVNHVFGPDSWEAWDDLVRLDGALARFFAVLDHEVGAGGWALVAAGDHGGPPLPEQKTRPWCAGADRWQRPCGGGRRITGEEVVAALEPAAAEVVGPGHWIDGVIDPYVILSKSARDLDPTRREKLNVALSARLAQIDGIASIHLVSKPAACPAEADESVEALVCRSIGDDSPGDLYVVTRPGAFFDVGYVVGKGQSHGTPWLYDRTVPLLARGPGVRRALVVEGPVSFTAYARTLSTLLGLPADPGFDAARP